MAVGLSALLVFVAVLIAFSVRQAAAGRLARNGAVGIRTSRALASDDAWRRVHQAALPWVYAATGVFLVVAALLPVFRGGIAVLPIVLVGKALAVTLLVLGTRRGHRALAGPAPGSPA